MGGDAQGFLQSSQRKKGSARLTFSAIETLVSIMCNEKSPAAARTAAAQAILDRGYGKPSQDIKIEEERQMFIISGDPLCEEEWERRYCI